MTRAAAAPQVYPAMGDKAMRELFTEINKAQPVRIGTSTSTRTGTSTGTSTSEDQLVLVPVLRISPPLPPPPAPPVPPWRPLLINAAAVVPGTIPGRQPTLAILTLASTTCRRLQLDSV